MKKLTALDQEYVEKLYLEMYTPMLNYAKGALLKESLAQEAVQETFLTACSLLDNLKSSPNPQGWIMNTLKHVIGKIKETRNIHNRYFLLDDSALSVAADPKAHHPAPALLYDGLISQEDYRLLCRIGIDGYSILELSDELGISLAACRKRIQRARERFRAQYDREIAQIEENKKR